jgi:hypothetical protein
VTWIGKAIRGTGKWLWKVISEIPTAIRDIAVWMWKTISVRLPEALSILAHWTASGLTSVAKLVWNAILKIVSFLATVVVAILSFFRDLTLKDIWNGFCDVLSAVFIAFPKLVGKWIVAFGDGSYKIMKLLLGEIGEILWCIGLLLLTAVTYVPKKLWIMVQSLGNVLARAGYEIRVWMNPKAR